jgi:hypothetical protein
MATSAVDICNLALAHLGDSANITSISPPDNSVQANYCSLFYPLALAAALDEHTWRFATRRVTLATRTNDASDEWDYCYVVPSDLVSIVELKSAGVDQQLIQYSQEIASDNAQVLYCNVTPVTLYYVSSSVLSLHFTPAFVQYLAALLASHLAGPMLKGDVGVNASNKLLSLAMQLKERAIERDGQSVRVVVDHVPATHAARL